MEIESVHFPLSSPSLFLLFFFLIFSVRILKKKKTSSDEITLKFPPGPPKLQLIGNIHNVVGRRLPHHVFQNLAHKYGPLMHLQLGEISTVVVSSAKLDKEVLVTHDPTFAGRPHNLTSKIIWYDQDIAFSLYGDYVKQMRKICMIELLNGKSVRSFRFIRKHELSKLRESIRSNAGVPINVANEIFAYTSSTTCRVAFGRICKDKEAMIEHLKTALTFAGGFTLADAFPSLKLLPLITGLKYKMLKIHHHIDEILDDVVQKHKVNHECGKNGNAESGDEDLIDVLLRQQETGNLQIPITTRAIKGVILDIFAGGTDTSSAIIEWAMSELIRNPTLMAKAQAEVRQVCKGKKTLEEEDIQKLKYLKMVIQETLRLHPPVPFVPRTSRKNCKISGYNDTLVMVNAWAICRESIYWNDAESF